jgi:integrator complex subunit 11
MKKVTAVNLHQIVRVDDDLEIQAFYAGHVLGAAMFYVRVGSESVLYTGDYNMTPDRHLGGARIPVSYLRPDVLITETTYATTIRDSKRSRERTFLQRVHQTVERGGKVLIPVFALGRAQELCILLETYWEQMNLGHIPIYFSGGMVEKANLYYKLFINWTNEKIKQTFLWRNMFDFKHIKPFERSLADSQSPMVLLASPGMLHAGLSLEIFKKWAPDEKNCCIIPGYCVVGTVGNKLLAGKRGTVEIDKRTTVNVNCQVENLSFSAHADVKGILQLIKIASPRTVVLVHGEKGKMAFLRQYITDKFKIGCYDPPNGSMIHIPPPSMPSHTAVYIPAQLDNSTNLTSNPLNADWELDEMEKQESDDINFLPFPQIMCEGVLTQSTETPEWELSVSELPVISDQHRVDTIASTWVKDWDTEKYLNFFGENSEERTFHMMSHLYEKIHKLTKPKTPVWSRNMKTILLSSLRVTSYTAANVVSTKVSWGTQDSLIAKAIIEIVEQMIPQ